MVCCYTWSSKLNIYKNTYGFNGSVEILQQIDNFHVTKCV